MYFLCLCFFPCILFPKILDIHIIETWLKYTCDFPLLKYYPPIDYHNYGSDGPFSSMIYVEKQLFSSSPTVILPEGDILINTHQHPIISY